MNKQFPLLVFDWDGTLVDSIERIVTSLQFASKQAENVTLSEAQARDVIGLGLLEAIAKLHPELDVQQDADKLNNIADAYRQHYLYDNKVPAPLFNGVNKLLNELHGEKYTLAISTGKSRAGLEQSINEHQVANYFSATRCAGENKSKPHPEMLHEILAELNFSASQTLMIGDSEHDLKMANNANVQCIGVTHGVHDAATLNNHKPLTCLTDITQLPHYLITSLPKP
ncbi:Similar to phosphoglycolate phosphatase, clustered with ribosomal large subunit pseudouridine synthase C [hydrothermal vent metagenome]|uniref:Similar to phosphoglycolate phosphatase, clustered with ribosomal large subunit pseudouridine synthase C n=1 Tax=hydrothermal vent metagenome TaxID=652676 RepID=A0A3B0WJ34_9ZZZZ